MRPLSPLPLRLRLIGDLCNHFCGIASTLIPPGAEQQSSAQPLTRVVLSEPRAPAVATNSGLNRWALHRRKRNQAPDLQRRARSKAVAF